MMTSDQLKNCSAPLLQGFVRRADNILDDESSRKSAEERAKIAAFRSVLVGELDSRVAKQ